MIRTVLGDVTPSKLSFCQSHEHIYIRPCPAQAGGPIADEKKSLAELVAYRSAGGRAIVDAQPVGAGRDAAVLERLSRQSGVYIIASTGFHKLTYYPAEHWVFSAQENELTRLFTGELEEGMFIDGDAAFPCKRGQAKAGQIKTALDVEGLAPPYRRLFAAAAKAAAITGRPLMTHIERDSDPVVLANFLEKQGLDANRIVFCHLDRAMPDLAVHKTLCQRGIYLEYDTIARSKYHDDDRELAIIMELVAAGYEKQLLMGLDTTAARLQSYSGEPGLVYIKEKFIQKLREIGILDSLIRLFFEENPARTFSKSR